MWTVENLEDVKSDMSVFHRVDDIASMPAASFFSRVERLVFYAGAVQAAAKIKQNAERGGAPEAMHHPSASGGARVSVPESVMLSDHINSGWAERA